jgi:hypothetical protein
VSRLLWEATIGAIVGAIQKLFIKAPTILKEFWHQRKAKQKIEKTGAGSTGEYLVKRAIWGDYQHKLYKNLANTALGLVKDAVNVISGGAASAAMSAVKTITSVIMKLISWVTSFKEIVLGNMYLDRGQPLLAIANGPIVLAAICSAHISDSKAWGNAKLRAHAEIIVKESGMTLSPLKGKLLQAKQQAEGIGNACLDMHKLFA